MQVGEESGDLLLVEAAVEGGHHSLPGEDDISHLCIRSRCAAGQRRTLKDSLQIGRHLSQTEIIIAMAVRTTHLIEVLPFRLLPGEFWSAVATGYKQDRTQEYGEGRNKALEPH